MRRATRATPRQAPEQTDKRAGKGAYRPAVGIGAVRWNPSLQQPMGGGVLIAAADPLALAVRSEAADNGPNGRMHKRSLQCNPSGLLPCPPMSMRMPCDRFPSLAAARVCVWLQVAVWAVSRLWVVPHCLPPV